MLFPQCIQRDFIPPHLFSFKCYTIPVLYFQILIFSLNIAHFVLGYSIQLEGKFIILFISLFVSIIKRAISHVDNLTCFILIFAAVVCGSFYLRYVGLISLGCLHRQMLML